MIRCARKGGMIVPPKGDDERGFEFKKGIIGVHERETYVRVPETGGGGSEWREGGAHGCTNVGMDGRMKLMSI